MQQAIAEQLLNWLLRGDTFTPPSNWYLGLDVSVSGAYTEPTYVGYARVALARATGSWVSATGAGQSVSAADVTWVTVPSGYTAAEQVRRAFISNQATAGGELLLDYVPITAFPTLAVGMTPRFVAGNLIVDV